MKRPPDSASSVIAVIARIAGVRAGICMIAVPSRMRVVCAPIQVERRDRVGAVGLGGPHRVEAEPLGLEDQIDGNGGLGTELTGEQTETHGGPPCCRAVRRRRRAYRIRGAQSRPGSPRAAWRRAAARSRSRARARLATRPRCGRAWRSMMPWESESPRPVPCPTGLVVKNGSKTRVAHRRRECRGRCPRTRAGRRSGVRAVRDADLALAVDRVAGVHQQIQEDLVELAGVAAHARQRLVVAHDLDAVLAARLHQRERAIDLVVADRRRRSSA